MNFLRVFCEAVGSKMKTLRETTNKKRKLKKSSKIINSKEDDNRNKIDSKKVKFFDDNDILKINKLRKNEFFDENFVDNFCFIKRLDDGLLCCFELF
jgi:hypothetical protein